MQVEKKPTVTNRHPTDLKHDSLSDHLVDSWLWNMKRSIALYVAVIDTPSEEGQYISRPEFRDTIKLAW
ncbi:uncharacterized protein EAF02_002902 [Botrytis sinoallii]|uniref:uncharacterized protein n=1 Tax=Botrytis sinoallii TaxID=1463999 RepID=UPI0019015B32|nr:uncharacterized protein EAF02_002902 [Botrytis sinoallii]KAF7888361.1 hypothetical protein EAF02_002902 [Botrytis sinoallii]